MTDSSNKSSVVLSNVDEQHTSICTQLVNFLCCIFDTQEQNEQENKFQSRKKNRGSRRSSRNSSRLLKNSLRNEKNELILAGDLNDGYNSLIRLTHKNFYVNLKQSQQNTNKQSIYFSLLEQGTRQEQSETGSLLPEKVLRYVTQRILDANSDIIIDANCWSNGPYLLYVDRCSLSCYQTLPLFIAINLSYEQLICSRHNSKIYENQDNIEFIMGDPLQILKGFKYRESNAIYWYPRFLQNDEPFSLHTHLEPSIRQIIPAMLSSSINSILILPKKTELHEIAALISYYSRKLNFSVDKFEIQQIQVDGYIECVVIYVGTIARVRDQDEFQFITQLLISDSNGDKLYQSTYLLLHKLTERSNFRTILDYAIQAQKISNCQSDTTLDLFLNFIKRDQLMDQQELNNYFYGSKEEQYYLQLNDTPCYRQSLNPKTPMTFDPNQCNKSPSQYTPLIGKHSQQQGINDSFSVSYDCLDRDSSQLSPSRTRVSDIKVNKQKFQF